MKKKLLLGLVILFMTTIPGCGTIDTTQTLTSESEEVVTVTSIPSISATPEPTIIPTATPTPTPIPDPFEGMDSLDKKYYYYDDKYISGAVSNSNPSEIEKLLSSMQYYATWYSSDNNTLDQELVITSTERDGKEYGIKCIIPGDFYDPTVYYFYFDDPETILVDTISLNDVGYYTLDCNDNRFANITSEQLVEYESIAEAGDVGEEQGDGEYLENYPEEEPLYTAEYVPLTVTDIYPYAKKSAENLMIDKLGISSHDLMFGGGFNFTPYFDVYYDCDTEGNYYLKFYIEYVKGADSISMEAECEYVDKDLNYYLTLKDVDLD